MNIIKGNLEKAKILSKDFAKQKGIGTYKEKSLHNIVKFLFEPNPDNHEIKIGSMVADILNENGIIEIQTRSFNNLRKKLDKFLPEYKVTVVYPYASVKWLVWLDLETGEISKRRKSPKRQSIFDSFYELYKIKTYLSHPNFNLILLGLELEETRLLNGWSDDKKKGSERFDRFPLSVQETTEIQKSDDYIWLIPANIPSPFTSSDYAKCASVSLKMASYALMCLTSAEIIKKVGKKGRKTLYEIA